MKLNVSAVQYFVKDILEESDFVCQVGQMTRQAMKNNPHFIVFPELFTTQFLSLAPRCADDQFVRYLDQYTDLLINLLRRLSMNGNVHIVGGSHVTKNENGRYVNRSYLFFPDGTYLHQDKLHLTLFEKEVLRLEAGDRLNIFETEWAKVAILICYDIEFPELSRKAAEAGAEIIFCPSWTESMHGVYRVDHCSRARAVENQLFVVKTAALSRLDGFADFSTNAGFAGLYSPCDSFFAEDGVIAKGANGKEMIVNGQLDLAALRESRKNSTAPLWKDRRSDLYSVEFHAPAGLVEIPVQML
jgi:predicted amidohydrolase